MSTIFFPQVIHSTLGTCYFTCYLSSYTKKSSPLPKAAFAN